MFSLLPHLTNAPPRFKSATTLPDKHNGEFADDEASDVDAYESHSGDESNMLRLNSQLVGTIPGYVRGQDDRAKIPEHLFLNEEGIKIRRDFFREQLRIDRQRRRKSGDSHQTRK